MIYKFTDIPQFVPVETYHAAIGKMVKRLLDTGKVKSVFQVGGITSPGISDIDLHVVFFDEVMYTENPVKDLSFPDNYLFTHRLFGTCERLAKQLEQYTFFGKYNFLGGEPLTLLNYSADIEQTQQLKKQIALEYLVKGWYSNAIGLSYERVKLRNFLLHAKAILLDLEFLEIKNGNLVSCIQDIMEVRKNWFTKKTDDLKLTELINRYDSGLRETILQVIGENKFFLSPEANFQLSNRVRLTPSENLNISSKGVKIPLLFTRLSDKLYKVQDKLNQFSLQLPVMQQNIPEVLMQRHNILTEAFKYNQKYLPDFLCTGHAMNVFLKD